MIGAALRYIDRGLVLRALDGKHAASRPFWTGEQARLWFEGGRYNVGIVTGPVNRLLVIDVDQGHIPARFPATFTVRTSRGWHLYYQYDEPAYSRPLTENIETRSGRGMRRAWIVAPPSIHPDGTPYAVARRGPWAPCPAWLDHQLQRDYRTIRYAD